MVKRRERPVKSIRDARRENYKYRFILFLSTFQDFFDIFFA
jgi:hypothetical protein|tara:strand:- start:431 stop:553 length:123 start_codon:yes stop_codon:yes gene_type:complete